jgi:hypothetical protein
VSKPDQYVADLAWAEEHFGSEALDPGIIRILRIFKEAGIETCQSCEGPKGMFPEGQHGVGHSYEHPTIDVLGEPWKALDVANTYAAQVDQISEVFGVRDGRPVEHFWRIEFNSRRLAEFRESWYPAR